MKTLPVRIISAVIGMALLILVAYFFNTPGVIIASFLACIVGSVEYQNILLKKVSLPLPLRLCFLIGCALILFVTIFTDDLLLMTWGLVLAIYFSLSLWVMRSRIEIEGLFRGLAYSCVGFLYCALLPTFAVNILKIENGPIWFFLLIAIVFVGDIAAYFGGILLGKAKLMPDVSPNKTWAGSISGLVGSVVAAGVIQHFGLPKTSMVGLMGAGAVAGFIAQSGDLFESLIKRVADVKDSGRIMPGHGGALDRLDGIYFAAPVVYAVAQYFQMTH
jgi:phosphatidate cytidylyltransferase